MEQNINIKKEPLNKKGAYLYVSPHHSFGTDALLLAHFAQARKNDSYVDLCTGCGIIPFVILRDEKTYRAYGVDISEEAVALAEKTVKERKLGDKFTPILADLNSLPDSIGFGCHTLVTCNPPYKPAGTGIKNPDSILAAARHEIFCTLDDVLDVAYRLLNTSGRFCMCHRPERLTEILSKMSRKGLEPKRLQFVCQSFGDEPFLLLVEGRKCAKKGMRILPTISLTESEEELKKIYGEYKYSME